MLNVPGVLAAIVLLGLAGCGTESSAGDPVLLTITLSPTQADLAVGQTRQLTATGTFSDGGTQILSSGLTWNSSSSAIATVDSGGLASAAAAGTVTITATDTATGISGTATLTVGVVLQSIGLSPAFASMVPGQTRQFTATGTFSDGTTQNLSSGLSWSASNVAVATVDSAGLATGLAAGTTTISATDTASGVSGSATLAVSVAVQAISISPALAAVSQGVSAQFSAVATFSDGSIQPLASGVSWASSDTTVASVGLSGLATGLAAGVATITATDDATQNSGSATLTVGVVLQGVTVSPATVFLQSAATQGFSAEGSFSDGTNQPLASGVVWSSNDPTVATVNSSSGVASTGANGAATITATDAATGLIGTALINVGATISSISVAPSTATLAVGETRAFAATALLSDGNSTLLTGGVTWSSGDIAVAAVDGAGAARGMGAGAATLRATHDASQAFATAGVTVTAPPGVTYWSTRQVALPAIQTAAAILLVPVPEVSAAAGMVLQGSNSNAKVIDHGVFLVDEFSNMFYILDPSGARAPLSFNVTHFVSPVENDFSNNILLYDNEATALFFPNDGSTTVFPAGAFTFPIASFDATGNALEADLLQPYLFYKVPTTQQTTLKLNVFLVSGTGGIATLAQAQADPELQGALAVLLEVYRDDPDLGLDVRINLEIIPDSSFTIIESFAEWDTLNRSFPNPPSHDAINIFIVGAISLGIDGLLGLAARIPGPFNRQGTIRSGTLAAYQGDGEGALLGGTLAHESGHFLGLYHSSQTNQARDAILGNDPIADTPLCTTADINAGGLTNCPDVNNLMFPIATGVPQKELTAGQGTVVRLNPAVTLAGQ